MLGIPASEPKEPNGTATIRATQDATEMLLSYTSENLEMIYAHLNG